MRKIDFSMSWVFAVLLLNLSSSAAALDRDQAQQKVKELTCKNNLNVEASLDQAVKAHSQRDIGWQVFEESGYFDVERSVLVSKGVEFRYRWRVFQDGRIQAENDRAEKLCLVEKD